jgi:hypothetical protein
MDIDGYVAIEGHDPVQLTNVFPSVEHDADGRSG